MIAAPLAPQSLLQVGSSAAAAQRKDDESSPAGGVAQRKQQLNDDPQLLSAATEAERGWAVSQSLLPTSHTPAEWLS